MLHKKDILFAITYILVGSAVTYGVTLVLPKEDLKESLKLSTQEWVNDDFVTVPTQWQSHPTHPTTTLTYITYEEFKLLKELDMHNSGVDVEDHFGPAGVPSLDGTSYGQGGYYSQGTYRDDRDQQGSSYSQSSYPSGGGGGADSGQAANYSQGSYSSGGGGSDSGGNNNPPPYVPPPKSLASIIWDATVKTGTNIVDAAKTLYDNVKTTVTGAPTITYTPLPNGQYLSNGGPNGPKVVDTTTPDVDPIPVTKPVPADVQAQIDQQIEEQQWKSGVVTAALTSDQKAQLALAAKPVDQGGLGLDMNNPAAVATFLSAVQNIDSPEVAIYITKRALGTNGATINGAAIEIAFGRSCGTANCAAAENLRVLTGFGGVGGPAKAQLDLEKQMQGIDDRIQREKEEKRIQVMQGGMGGIIQTGGQPTTPVPGGTISAEAEEARKAEEARQAEIDRLLAINNPVGVSTIPDTVKMQVEAAERAAVGKPAGSPEALAAQKARDSYEVAQTLLAEAKALNLSGDTAGAQKAIDRANVAAQLAVTESVKAVSQTNSPPKTADAIAAEAQRVAAEKARIAAAYAEYARTRSMSDSVPMDEAYNSLRTAEAELAEAKRLAEGSAIDSERMFAYADAQKRYNDAVASYDKAIDLIDSNNESGAITAVKQVTESANGSKISSELLTKPQNDVLDSGSGSGIVGSQEKVYEDAADYLWERYQKTDFSWKDQKAADKLGLTLKEYVIGGIDPQLTINLAAAGKKMEAAGIPLQITSGFRDDYRQSLIEAGIHAVTGVSWHGNSGVTDGLGDGKAVDISGTAAQEWMDKNGADFGLARPYGDRDAPHIALASSPEAQRRIGGMPQQQVDAITQDIVDKNATQNNVFMDFDQHINDVQNGTQNDIRIEDTRTNTQKIVDTAIEIVTNPLGFLDNLFSGNPATNPTPTQPSDNDDNEPTIPKPPVGPLPGTELYTVANGATPTGRVSTTSLEYKFTGSITRKILYGEDGLPLTDIEENYADTLSNSLSLDYLCDGTVNATSSFPLAYTAFDATQETSQVLVSQYLPVREYGTHCYFFTVDTSNTVVEAREDDNVSNKYRFIVAE